ncbi:MAG TPA: hypothetical protein VM263_11890 [Acidimicrobiales bacterium]|nr:hypothetical protein [Acidimicrobiales bacterium]
MSRRDALVLRAFAGWTVFVWGNRMWNILGDDEHGAGFKAVHLALALVSVTFAVAAWRIVARSRRRARVDVGS